MESFNDITVEYKRHVPKTSKNKMPGDSPVGNPGDSPVGNPGVGLKNFTENYDLICILCDEISMLFNIYDKDISQISVLDKIGSQINKLYECINNIKLLKNNNLNGRLISLYDQVCGYYNNIYLQNKVEYMTRQDFICEHDLDIMLSIYFTFINLCSILPSNKSYWNMVKTSYNNIMVIIESDIYNIIEKNGRDVKVFQDNMKKMFTEIDNEEFRKKYQIISMRSTDVSNMIMTQIMRHNMDVINECVKKIDKMYDLRKNNGEKLKSYTVIKKFKEELYEKYNNLTSVKF